MKRFLICTLLLISLKGFAQNTDDLLNLLIANKTISQQAADSLRAEYAIVQQNSKADKRLRIDFEFRPRAEYRNGYQQLRNDTTTGAFFINQRSRLTANYSLNNRLNLQFSVQDLRVWGQQDPRSTAATLQLFEAWAEPYLTNRLSLRIGRQKLVYDNQRLFAENDWRMSSAVHDAVTLRYYGNKLVSEFAIAFNQTSERFFGTDYTPKDYTNYKFLAVSYIKYNPSKYITLTGLNSADGYQAKSDPEKMYMRYTLGGRIEGEKDGFYATLAGWLQTGRNPAGKSLSSWYLQPEIRTLLTVGLTARIGAEFFSGDSNDHSRLTDHSFVPLYGVAHRFNGSMDLITKFPNDTKNAGLVNPYLFIIKSIGKKAELRSDFHTFSLMKDYYQGDNKISKFLGFENDWLFSYKPNQVLRIDLGFSYMSPSKSFQIIKGSGNAKYDLTWTYVSFIFKPVIFNTTFK